MSGVQSAHKGSGKIMRLRAPAENPQVLHRCERRGDMTFAQLEALLEQRPGDNGFSSIKLQSYDAAGAHFGQPGYGTDLLYMAGLLALCVGGAGPLSFDRYLARRVGKHSSLK